MITPTPKIKTAALLCAISLLNFSLFALACEMKDADGTTAKQNRIEIKDFAFNPQKITVKSGEKITWINRDAEPHTVVRAGKKNQRSDVLDTDQHLSIIAVAPGPYEYF